MFLFVLQVTVMYALAALMGIAVEAFGASLFGNRFIYRNHFFPTKPNQAYKLRKPYAETYGPFGENYIHTVGIT